MVEAGVTPDLPEAPISDRGFEPLGDLLGVPNGTVLLEARVRPGGSRQILGSSCDSLPLGHVVTLGGITRVAT